MIAQVPELWDGGYWYSFEPTLVTDQGGEETEYFAPPVPPPFWSCYVIIDNTMYGACRTPLPVVVPACSKPVSVVIEAALASGALPEAVKFSTRYYVAGPDPVPAEGP